MIITAAQVREARKLLSLTLTGLAAQSGVDAKHLDAFERGKRRMSVLDLSVIQRAMEGAGIDFISEHGAAGVRLRKGAAK
jgi:transcriptional regulator with XRE-family HTH domain